MINKKCSGYTPTRFTAPRIFDHLAYSDGHYLEKRAVSVSYKARRSLTINY